MKNTTKKNITRATEFVLSAVSVIAVFTLILTLIGMLEAQSVSGTPLTLAIVSAAWLVIIGIYTYIVRR